MNVSILIKKTFCFWALLFGCLPLFAQDPVLSNNAKISVITCDVGNESYSLFGHTALRIQDSINNLDVVYNYGAFDFQTPNFVAKFAKGDLQYFAVANTFTDFISEYLYLKRSVFEQELTISTALKQQLFENLNASLRSGDSQYTYKFIDKNCTSMLVDILNKTLGGAVIVKKENTNISFRSILYPYFDGHFYEQLGTSIIFGTKVDQAGTHLFLPFELMKSLEKTQYGGTLLAKKTKNIIDEKKIPEDSWWNNWYSYVLVLGLIVVLNLSLVNQIYFIIAGGIGALFIFLGFYSEHLELANNYNVLLLNPVLIVLAFILNNKKLTKLRTNLVYFNLGLLAIYLLILINKAHFVIVLPLIATNCYLFIKIILKDRKNLLPSVK